MKTELLTLALEKTRAKFNTLKSSMAAAQEAANEESKSSAGDKYETGRAMAQNDLELLGGQLKEVEKDLKVLQGISAEKPVTICSSGALIATDLGLIFIATSLGFLEVLQQKIMLISLASPLGQALKGKSAGEKFEFRGKEFGVQNVC